MGPQFISVQLKKKKKKKSSWAGGQTGDADSFPNIGVNAAHMIYYL